MEGGRVEFENQLLRVIPDLRAFARFLTGNPIEADDLVQDTIVRALRSYKQFDLSTNIKSWTFTILRNLRINSFRTSRSMEEFDDEAAFTVPVSGGQEDSLGLKQVLAAMQKLPAAQRAVIALVRAQGMTYEETAAILGCKLGTIKSRLNRADAALRALLGADFLSARVSASSPRKAAAPVIGPLTARGRTGPLKMPRSVARLDSHIRWGCLEGRPGAARRRGGQL
jgi:RNA polymerase sigma-70 factor (ECF subfamily)